SLGWTTSEYGLSISRGTTDSGGRFLSSETLSNCTSTTFLTSEGNYRVSCGTRWRSRFETYEFDSDAVGFTRGPFDRNARLKGNSTVYDDDQNCSGDACAAAVTNYNFDDAGHYRQSSTSGNFGGGNFRTTFTNFASVSLNGTWLLNTYTEVCAVDESKERTASATACSGLSTPPAGGQILSGPFVGQLCFDSSTGFLKRHRMLIG